MQARDPRKDVLVPARVRNGDLWAPILIRNVSKRGMMIEISPPPPPKGSFLQVATGDARILGCVVWSGADRVGVQTVEDVTDDYLEGRSPDSSQLKAGEKHRDLLNELAHCHAALAAAIDEMARITESEKPKPEIYVQARYRLCKLSKTRRVLAQAICTDLLRHAPSHEARIIRQLQADAVRRQLESALHVQKCTVSRTAENWAEYRAASVHIRRSLAERTLLEKEILYPLLRRSTEHPQGQGA